MMRSTQEERKCPGPLADWHPGKLNNNIVWGVVIVALGLIGSITFLVAQGKDYNGILVLISSIGLLAVQLITLFRQHTMSGMVSDVKDKVNGQMSSLLDKVAGGTKDNGN
jgi:signal transduction histidine kinase